METSMRKQVILGAADNYIDLDNYMSANGICSIFLVCGSSIKYTGLQTYFEQLPERLQMEVVWFCDFSPNPTYESVEKGVSVFRNHPCDMIVAVGGGSAIDVGKCIKIFHDMNPRQNYLEQKIVPNDLHFLAIPTTAGTGSEATRFAVIYYKGEKQSVTHESCIPEAVLFDASTLTRLPEYHKKASMLDALCHAAESYWSVNSTEESKEYSKKAIQMICANMDSYLANEGVGNERMLEAANIAGKAINITQTTAGHAMCYKLTSLYGIAHGHAAALCVKVLFRYMYEHTELCIDSRGKEYLEQVLVELSDAMGCGSIEEGVIFLEHMIDSMELMVPTASEAEYELLCTSVNPERLRNHPIALDKHTIDILYHVILK